MFTGNSRLLSWKLKIMRSCIKFMLLDDIYHLLKSCQHDDLHIFMFLSRHLSPSISCQIKHLNPHNSEVILLTLEKQKHWHQIFYEFIAAILWGVCWGWNHDCWIVNENVCLFWEETNRVSDNSPEGELEWKNQQSSLEFSKEYF